MFSYDIDQYGNNIDYPEPDGDHDVITEEVNPALIYYLQSRYPELHIYKIKENPAFWWRFGGWEEKVDEVMEEFIFREVVSPEGEKYYLPRTEEQIAKRISAITFLGTNIPRNSKVPCEFGGEPAFDPFFPIVELEAEFDRFGFNRIMNEIWEEVGSVFRRWGPRSDDIIKFLEYVDNIDYCPKCSRLISSKNHMIGDYSCTGCHDDEVNKPKPNRVQIPKI